MVHEELGREIGKLVDEKDLAYGNAIDSCVGILTALYPNGINPPQYRDAALIVRVGDKLSRIAKGDKNAFNENPWQDIAGYGLRGANGN
jgi:hypothetical protein